VTTDETSSAQLNDTSKANLRTARPGKFERADGHSRAKNNGGQRVANKVKRGVRPAAAALRYGCAGAPADGGEDAPEEHAGNRHVVEREQRAERRADEVDELQRPALHGEVRRPEGSAHLDVLVEERRALLEVEVLLLHASEL
jgi:hypothetical protein